MNNMTIEKAIEQLEDLIKEAESHMTGNKIDDEIPIDDKTALEMAIQALEKQVPKKPIVKTSYICGKKYYCSECGQALDWSDENE